MLYRRLRKLFEMVTSKTTNSMIYNHSNWKFETSNVLKLINLQIYQADYLPNNRVELLKWYYNESSFDWTSALKSLNIWSYRNLRSEKYFSYLSNSNHCTKTELLTRYSQVYSNARKFNGLNS